MKSSSLFVARLAVAFLSIASLLCGQSGTAMSQTATPSDGAVTWLPTVVVRAPKQVAGLQKRRAAARSTVSPRTSPTIQTSSATSMSMSPAAKLAKFASTTGSCVDGCQTSFSYGGAPWHGCSVSAGTLSPTCRNAGNFKTYAECMEAGLLVGWRSNEEAWYCTSLALK